jgi:hypothetical protein
MSSTVSLLADFDPEDEFARANGPVSKKTVQRYRNEPNGLPFLTFGGKIWIGPRDEAREWLLRRVRRPNPRRKA